MSYAYADAPYHAARPQARGYGTFAESWPAPARPSFGVRSTPQASFCAMPAAADTFSYAAPRPQRMSATSYRTRARNPFEAQLPAWATRVGRTLAAEVLDTAQAVRPTRLMAAAQQRVWPAPTPAPQSAQAYAAPASRALWAARMAQCAAGLGAALGFVLDALVVSVAVAGLLPVLVLRALMLAWAPKGLYIDRSALRPESVETAFRKIIEAGVEKVKAAGEDAVSSQLKVDLGRQTMHISFWPDLRPLLMPRELGAALPQLKALCADEAGHVPKAWLWAVTDMSAQGLLNEIYAHLLCSQATTYNGLPCALNLNGETTYTLRRLTSDKVSVLAQMRAPNGMHVGLLTPPAHGSSFVHDTTPVRLDVEVHINKPKNEGEAPEVSVEKLEMGLL